MWWRGRRWIARVLLALAALPVPATMGILVDEDDLGGSLFLGGVAMFVAAALLHCRTRHRLMPVLAGFGVGFAAMQLLILLAITISPPRVQVAEGWGWRDAALGIGMSLMMATGTLCWSLGTDPLRRAAGWSLIPVLCGIAASVLPVPAVHEHAAGVAMVAALAGAVLCEVFPGPGPVEDGEPRGG